MRNLPQKVNKNLKISVLMLIITGVSFLPNCSTLVDSYLNTSDIHHTNSLSQNYYVNEHFDENKKPLCTLEIGNITLTITIVVPEQHMRIVFQSNNSKVSLEYFVNRVGDRYRTVVFFNRRLVVDTFHRINLLKPLEKKTSESTTTQQIFEQTDYHMLADSSKVGSAKTVQYTYAWWDGIRQVTGPSYLIKYHHPDRDYYQISKWDSWTITTETSKTFHNQIGTEEANFLAQGGWAAVFGAVGAGVGWLAGSPYDAAAIGLLSAALGALFGYYTDAALADEEGCIWWWSKEYNDWYWANAWWLTIYPQIGMEIAMLKLTEIGYVRIGDYTFVDALGIGNP